MENRYRRYRIIAGLLVVFGVCAMVAVEWLEDWLWLTAIYEWL